MNPGIHLFHKDVGPTSFSIVKSCIDACVPNAGHRRPRVCHGGTLDPFASGLLLILVEPATRLFDYLHAIPKTYEATIAWGVETSTGDPLGAPTRAGDASDLSIARIEAATAALIGWHEQIPPDTSARRVGGERAYEKVHRGETVVMPPVRVYLHEATWLDHDLPGRSRVRLVVRGGYYIRALARDLGRTLGCGAHVERLRRVSIGPWLDPGTGASVFVQGRDLLPWASAKLLSDQDVGDLRAGLPIAAGTIEPPDWTPPAGFPDPAAPVRGFHGGKFRFLLAAENDRLRLIIPLRGGL